MANLRLACILADAGCSVDVITYPYGDAPQHPGVVVHRCRPVAFIKRVGIGFSPAKLITDISLAFHAFGVFLRTRFDCIHGVEEGVFIALLLGLLMGVPVIYDMDSIMSMEISGSSLGWFPPMVWLIRALERWAISHSALVITICDAMAQYAREVGHARRVVVIPDVPVTPDAGGPDPERARRQLPPGLPDGYRIIAYTGSLAVYQGIELLMSAMPEVVSRHPEVLLLVVGGDDKNIARLSRLAKSRGVEKSILFLGKRPPEQVPDFLALADVLVSPRRGGINPPGKIYTYMQSGKPMVATRVPAHEAVLSDRMAVLVDATSTGLADGICRVLDDPSRARKLASNARRAVSRLTPEFQARKFIEAYENLRLDSEPASSAA